MAVGTSNCGNGVGSSDCNPRGDNMPPDHGNGWAKMVAVLQTFVKGRGHNKKIDVEGASDIQLAYNDPPTTTGWVRGYFDYWAIHKLPFVPLYDYGSCDSCLDAMNTDGNINPSAPLIFPETEWYLKDVYQIAAGDGVIFDIPEVYA